MTIPKEQPIKFTFHELQIVQLALSRTYTSPDFEGLRTNYGEEKFIKLIARVKAHLQLLDTTAELFDETKEKFDAEIKFWRTLANEPTPIFDIPSQNPQA